MFRFGNFLPEIIIELVMAALVVALEIYMEYALDKYNGKKLPLFAKILFAALACLVLGVIGSIFALSVLCFIRGMTMIGVFCVIIGVVISSAALMKINTVFFMREKNEEVFNGEKQETPQDRPDKY